jgi:hypothetical protein
VTSNRRRKQKAQSLGLTEAEMQLCELLGQVLELLRWNQVLGYSNQYLLHEKLGIAVDERHRVMRAAAQAVEQDGRLQDWGRRLLEVQDALRAIQARMNGADGAHADGAANGTGGTGTGGASGSGSRSNGGVGGDGAAVRPNGAAHGGGGGAGGAAATGGAQAAADA